MNRYVSQPKQSERRGGDVPALNELERRLLNLGNALDYNKSYPRKNIMEDVDLIRKQFSVFRANLSAPKQEPVNDEPFCFIHRLLDEKKHSVETQYTFSDHNPFGLAGHEYDKTYEVRTSPLYSRPQIPITVCKTVEELQKATRDFLTDGEK